MRRDEAVLERARPARDGRPRDGAGRRRDQAADRRLRGARRGWWGRPSSPSSSRTPSSRSSAETPSRDAAQPRRVRGDRCRDRLRRDAGRRQDDRRRELAGRLGVPFVDLDAEIEREAGASVSDIFRTEGEASFRALEAAALVKASMEDPSVVACGAAWSSSQPTGSPCGTRASPSTSTSRWRSSGVACAGRGSSADPAGG